MLFSTFPVENYLTTIFTILPLITIILTISFPSVCFCTFSVDKAFSFIESSSSLTLIFIVARTFPLTWTAISFSSSRVFELEGKDGAYNLYESELRQNVIINNLEKVNDNLEEIKDNQYCMYNELKNVNSSLQTINKNLIDGLNDIAKIEMANLAVNTEIAKNVKTIKRIQVYDYIMNK